MFVDSHCHLADYAFDADRVAVIERARAAGVARLLCTGGGDKPDEFDSALPLAERHEWIYAAAGFHPHEAATLEERHFDRLREAVRRPKVVAIGEIGLDYHYDLPERDVQKRVLVHQFDIARETKLPVVIHCRDAWGDLEKIFQEQGPNLERAGILHCFSGTIEDAKHFMDRGFLISFAGNVTFKNAEALRAVARQIPLECLLTETDSPYLAPVPHRGKRNEPARVREVTRALAGLRGMREEEFAERVARNFAEFFQIR
ncbi:MAG: TatD family deoxyribonuclease [Acidobacteria bacterium]|nr:MAG: TatD family deoxyribonuclease [Acidobacteriota bacterium]